MNISRFPQSASPKYRTLRLAAIFLLALHVVACETAPPVSDSAVLKENVAGSSHAPDAPAYEIDAQASEIRLRVYRDGVLARFGHNHLIVGPVSGHIYLGATPADSGFALRIPVTELRVDPPAARAAAGAHFTAEISAEARRDTRANMLGEDQLDAKNYPEIVVESLALKGTREQPRVTARVTLRGATRDVRFPATVIEKGSALVVTAEFSIRQSDFGIEPFNAFGGGLQVRDMIEVSVRLVARRM